MIVEYSIDRFTLGKNHESSLVMTKKLNLKHPDWTFIIGFIVILFIQINV